LLFIFLHKLAVPLYFTRYIELTSRGVNDMIERFRNVGLPEQEFSLTDGFVTIVRRRPDLDSEK